MYRRIEELAEGKLHTEVPILAIQPKQLALEPVEGVGMTGSFLISSIDRTPMKGIVYSDDVRMEVKNSQFQGEEVQICYEFHSAQMQEGETAAGTFFVVSNGGEFEVPWSVTVKRLYAETTIGRITSLNEFVRLYRVNWRESLHVFSAPGFRRLLRSTSEQLYERLLAVKPVTRTNIEEFLVACGKKARVQIQLEKHEARHLLLLEPVEEHLILKKSDWGYTELTVSSDAAFLEPEKEVLTSDDFNGSYMQFRYRLYPDRMHDGKNFARLTFKNALQQELYEVTASKRVLLDLARDERDRLKHENLQLLRDYEQFLDGSIVLGEWAKRTTRLLRKRKERGESSELDMLWCAYAFLRNRQTQEAAWITDEYRRTHSTGNNHEWAFYLYLCTLTEKEPRVLEKLQREIRELYRANHEHAWMRFLIMQIAEQSPDVSGRQLKLMEQWFFDGLNSPFLFARAADIYLKEPYLLLQLEYFELHVMHWICRHKRLTRDLCEQIVRRALSVRTYTWILDDILRACYEAYPQEEMLAGVCAYRIKGQRFDADAHAWYELAIEHDLQLTGLYEAFMASLDAREVRRLPKAVQLYFQYTNNLNYRQKAVLYVNIIAHREEQPTVYERYQQMIREFAQEQILAGHIDDNLAIIYTHTLDRLVFTPELAHALARILYIHKFICQEASFTHVIVQQENLRQPQIYPIVDHQAYVPVYPGNYVILVQDAHGKRLALPSDTQLERLMNPGKYIRKCLEQAPEELAYVLHHMNGKTKLLHMDERMAGYVRTLVRSDAVSEVYKSRISPGFLEYCRGEGFSADIRDYVTKIDFGRLERNVKDQYIESMIQLQMYAEAWTFLVQYGAGSLSAEALLQVVLYELQQQPQQENEQLLCSALQCFLNGNTKRALLEYLCSHYQGPTKHMTKIWRAAMKLQLSAAELEERLLVQMLFSSVFSEDVQQIFADYCVHQGRRQVRLAYLTYFSSEAVLREGAFFPALYPHLERATLGNDSANVYLRLALLKYYSGQEILTVQQETFADEQLVELLEKEQLYPFFLQFPARQLVRHHLYDACAVAFRAAHSDTQVWLHYRICGGDNAFQQVQLTPALDNLYLWHTRLVAGERLEYYISEKNARMECVTENRTLELSVHDGLGDNRHARLSQMAATEDMEQLKEQMEKYQSYEGLVGKLFGVC